MSSFKFLVKLSDVFTWDKDETKGKKIKTLTKIKITYGIHNPEIEEPVACDVHIYDPELPESLLLKYSSVGQDGSRIADRSVLLAMKIRSYGERSRNNDGKRVTDLEDIIQLFDWMEEAKENIPEDIVNGVLTPNCLRKFKEVAFPDDTATVFTYLADVGVNVESIFSKADSAVSDMCTFSVLPSSSDSCRC